MRGRVPGKEFVLSQDVANCLASLGTPTPLADVQVSWGLKRETIASLLDLGLLEEAEAATPDTDVFSDFFPRLFGCPRGPVGNAQVTFIGAPCDFMSQTGVGARNGPAALRMASTQLEYAVDSETSAPLGWYDCATGKQCLANITLSDAGDITPCLGQSHMAYGARISKSVRTAAALGSLPVLIGGDHSVSYWGISAVQGISESPFAVLHLDAHSDLSPRSQGNGPANGGFARWVIEENPEMPFVTAGLKGFLPAEQPSLSGSHTLLTASDILREGFETVLSFLPEELPCYVTLDIDVLDPSAAPGTNVPVPGGLRFEDVRQILRMVGTRHRLVGVDVVEINPDRDLYSRSASIALHLVLTLLGAAFGNQDATKDRRAS